MSKSKVIVPIRQVLEWNDIKVKTPESGTPCLFTDGEHEFYIGVWWTVEDKNAIVTEVVGDDDEQMVTGTLPPEELQQIRYWAQLEFLCEIVRDTLEQDELANTNLPAGCDEMIGRIQDRCQYGKSVLRHIDKLVCDARMSGWSFEEMCRHCRMRENSRRFKIAKQLWELRYGG